MGFAATTSSRESTIPHRPIGAAHRLVGLACISALCCAGIARAQSPLPVGPGAGGTPPILSFDTPLGAFDYRAGRGLRIGDTGLTVGGFSTVEIDDEAPGEVTVELDSVNFLVLFEPIEPLRFFAELEIGGLAAWQREGDDFDHDPSYTIERLHADWTHGDALNLRLGKFQTPVGRWNLVPAEPFVWTAVEPVQLDRAFDEHQTGAALYGTFYPGGNPLRWWLYGQLIDPLDPDVEFGPSERTAGARLEYGDGLGSWSVGGSLLASERKNEWTYLAGFDWMLRLGPLEISSEAVFAEGGIPDRDLWSVYVQCVHDLGRHASLLHDVYLVARFEHFDPDGQGNDSAIWDTGVTWIPAPWLNLKAGYRFADRTSDSVIEGITASLSVLF